MRQPSGMLQPSLLVSEPSPCPSHQTRRQRPCGAHAWLLCAPCLAVASVASALLSPCSAAHVRGLAYSQPLSKTCNTVKTQRSCYQWVETPYLRGQHSEEVNTVKMSTQSRGEFHAECGSCLENSTKLHLCCTCNVWSTAAARPMGR